MPDEDDWGDEAITAALNASKRETEVANQLGSAPAAAVAEAAGPVREVGRFAEHLQALGLTKEKDEAKQRAQSAAKGRYALSKALQNKNYDKAVEEAEAVQISGEKVPNDLVFNLLLAVADLERVKLFGRTLRICARAKVRFDEYGFATLIGKLISREAPHGQIRASLNFGVRPDADVVPLEPGDCRDSEKKDTYKGMDKDDGMDDEVSDSEKTGKGQKFPRVLEMRACTLMPRLNGFYMRKQPEPHVLGHSLPVYEKRVGLKERYLVYFWDEAKASEPSTEWKTGWYVGSQTGGAGETFAHSPCKVGASNIPPTSGAWRIKKNKLWRVDYPGFWPAKDVSNVVLIDTAEVENSLNMVELTELRGAVQGKNEETCTYFCHFMVLLTLEHLTELRGFRGRWGFRSVEELVSFGLCFNGIGVDEIVSSRDESSKVRLPGWPEVGAQTVAFKLPWGCNEEKCRFKSGESVIISRQDPLKRRICEGSVLGVDFIDRRLTVTLNGQLPEDPNYKFRYRLDTYANRTTYERQMIALLQFVAMKRTKIQDMLVAAEVGQVDLAVLGGDGFSADKDTLGGKVKKDDDVVIADTEEQKSAKLALQNWDDDTWFTKQLKGAKMDSVQQQAKKDSDAERKKKTLSLADEMVEGVDMDRLAQAEKEVATMGSVSDAQRNAIINSMSKRLTIVQGPPGTGKTHTSVRIITKWVKTMGYKPLLATSECNIAVDNIAIGLVKNGVKVVRMGNAAKVREELAAASMVNLIKKKQREMRQEADEESDEEEDVGEEPWEDPESEEWRAWDRRRMARRRKKLWDQKQQQWIKAQLLSEAEVIAATTVNSGSNALNGVKFHGILIDEVAQATETSSIVPIVCRGALQLVLCGDHCQLPPSVQSREAEQRGYSLSLYSRLVEAGVPFRFLDTQYRAHPQLMEFSAQCIYQGKLKSGIDGSDRLQVKGVKWGNKVCPAAFFECGAEEHMDGESKANESEARMVLKLVQDVLDAGELTSEEIGLVTPYKGQVRTMRRIIHANLKCDPIALKNLEMASVDNFQGREKELIVFSAVRCNDYGGVGFLKDWRRLNVMITRARRGLVIIGNAVTLCHDIHWRQWLQFTQKQGGCPMNTVEDAMAVVEDREGQKGKGKGKGKKRKEDDTRKEEDESAKRGTFNK